MRGGDRVRDEQRRLWIVRADLEVVQKQRLECGVDGHDSLAAALRPSHLQQATLEVDILPPGTPIWYGLSGSNHPPPARPKSARDK